MTMPPAEQPIPADPFGEDYWSNVNQHGRTCDNCGHRITRAPTPTGWTHDDDSWQGVRCPGLLNGATPVEL